MTKEYYNVKQLAKALGTGESTISYWRDKYKEYISCIGSGRKRRYSIEALNVLYFIAECVVQSMDKVRDALGIQFNFVDIIKQMQRKKVAVQHLPPLPGEIDIVKLMKELSESGKNFANELMNRLDELIETQKRCLETQEQLMSSLKKMSSQEKRIAELETQLSHILESKTVTKLTLKKTRKPDVYKADIIKHIVEMRDKEGLSFSEIARRFNTEGLKTLSGRGKWRGGTVGNFYKKAKGK